MKILCACKRFMTHAGIGSGTWVKIGKHVHIPQILIRSAIMLAQIILGAAQAVNSLNNYFSDDKMDVLYPLHCLLYNSTKLATYCAFIPKINEITELIEYLEMTVTERM